MIGCFGLTEPDHGSNPGGMVTNIKDAGDHVILNGAKMWISNAPLLILQLYGLKMRKESSADSSLKGGMEGFTTGNAW